MQFPEAKPSRDQVLKLRSRNVVTVFKKIDPKWVKMASPTIGSNNIFVPRITKISSNLQHCVFTCFLGSFLTVHTTMSLFKEYIH